MPDRTIAIGDIHGCATAFRRLVEAIEPRGNDTLITLGDYVDRGIDSCGVLDFLIELAERCRLVPILGNHDEMMLGARQGHSDLKFWLACGGQSALDSYGEKGTLELVPRAHFRFNEQCRPWFETGKHLFVHANYQPDLPLERQEQHALRWLSLRDYVPLQHMSEKIAVVGHTPQASGEILDLGYLKCIDTGCCSGGWLTALDVGSGRVWQVNERGELRDTN